MKVGDLIRDKRWDDAKSHAVIVRIGDLRTKLPYHVLCFTGRIVEFPKKYIQDECEVVSEGR